MAKFCGGCGGKVSENAKFCPGCSADLSQFTYEAPSASVEGVLSKSSVAQPAVGNVNISPAMVQTVQQPPAASCAVCKNSPSAKCDVCSIQLCGEHIMRWQFKDGTAAIMCPACNEARRCSICNKPSWIYPKGAGLPAVTCHRCGKKLCGEHRVNCSDRDCGNVMCPDHTVACASCGLLFCVTYIKVCPACDQKTCGEHKHKLYGVPCGFCGRTIHENDEESVYAMGAGLFGRPPEELKGGKTACSSCRAQVLGKAWLPEDFKAGKPSQAKGWRWELAPGHYTRPLAP